MFRGRAEQSLKAAPQVGSFANVRLRLRVVSAKEKNSRRGGDEREVFSIAIGDEFEATGKHKVILVCSIVDGRLFPVESNFGHLPHSLDGYPVSLLNR